MRNKDINLNSMEHKYCANDEYDLYLKIFKKCVKFLFSEVTRDLERLTVKSTP